MKLNVRGKRTCLSLPKESQLNKESSLIVGTESKEDKEYHCDIINENEVTDRVNAIHNDFSESAESFLEDFRTFKKSFFAEVNVFMKQLLASYTTDNVNKSNNSDRLIILLEENIAFLKEQVSKKDEDKVNSLLNQLSKQNDLAPHSKTSNTISIQTELITVSKLAKSSKKSKKSNTETVKSENKNTTHIDPKQPTSLPKNANSASTKENADNREDNSSINSRDINLKSKKSIVTGDSILKYLDGWEMSKKVKSEPKIFFPAFFRRNNKLHGGLHETVFAKRPKSYNPSCRNKRPNPR